MAGVREALRAMLTADRPEPLPGVSTADLVEAFDDLRGEAFVALASRGFPPAVVEDSLADIPRKVELYGDLVDDDWLVKVFCGHVVALGRLQFERGAGDAGRHLHIPEGGPLAPEAVDESLALATRYFGDDVPLICESWIFDERLGELPACSNLRRFVDRFDWVPAASTVEGARTLATFVFRSTPERVAAAPLRTDATSVERIAHAALVGDGRWSRPLATLRPRT